MSQLAAPSQILIVDDDAALARALARAIQADDRAIELAHDVAGGCQVVRERRLDLVVCDYELPDGDGRAVLRCSLELQSSTPRILLTGRSEWNVAKLAVNDGEIFRVLEKPCDTATFRGAVEAALQRKQRSDGQQELRRIADGYGRDLAHANERLTAECAAQTIELHRQRQELVEALLHAAELRHPGARRRAHEVEAATARIGAAMGLEPAQTVELQAASLLHEVGLVALDDRQLREADGGLDDHSLQVAEASATIVEHVAGLQAAARLIRLLAPARAGVPVALGARILALVLRHRELSLRLARDRVRGALEREVSVDAALVAAILDEPS